MTMEGAASGGPQHPVGPQIPRASSGTAAMHSHLPRVENGVSPTLRPQEVSDGAVPTSPSLGGATGAPPEL